MRRMGGVKVRSGGQDLPRLCTLKNVYCQMATHVHSDKTKGEDDSICIIEFDKGFKSLSS